MQQDNNIENKLREMEGIEQPDLSQMDAHWQQMATVLQPATLPVKRGWPKWMLNMLSAVAVIVLIGAAVWFLSIIKNDDVNKNTIAIAENENLPGDNQDTNKVVSKPVNTIADSSVIQVNAPIIFHTPFIDPSLVYNDKEKGDAVQWTEQDSILATIKLNVKDCLDCPGKKDDIVVMSSAERQMKLQNLFTELEKEGQHFTIDNSRDTLLHFEEGTVLLIPAKSLGGMNGAQLTAKEFYKTSDIILNQLNTASNKQQLETGGMLQLSASYNGSPINVDKQKPLLLFMKDTSARMASMQLFTGSGNDRSIQVHSNMENAISDKLSHNQNLIASVTDASGSDAKSFVNWVPEYQYFSKKRITTLVRVLNIIDQPLSIEYGPNGEDRMKASFVVSDSLAVEKKELKKMLRAKFGYYKIKLKPDYRNWFKQDNYNRKEYNRDLATRIGDSLWMEKETADMYKLIPTATKNFVNYDLQPTVSSARINNALDLSGDNSLISEMSKKYGVQLSNLGWINCDRFYTDTRKKINYKVDLDDSAANYYTMLVFDKINSMMTGAINGNQVTFQNIPLGEPVKIISIGINKQGETVYSVTHTTTSGQELKGLQFQTTSAPDLKASLSKLDK